MEYNTWSFHGVPVEHIYKQGWRDRGQGPGARGRGPRVFGDKEAVVGVRTFLRETPRGRGRGPLSYGMDPDPQAAPR